MHALEGRLSEGALANLVQFLALNQASGCLQLLRDVAGVPGGSRGAVYLAAGRVEHVEVGVLEGVAALSELLAWGEGRFAFAAGVIAPRRSLDLSVEALLLHASVRCDTTASRNGSAQALRGQGGAGGNGRDHPPVAGRGARNGTGNGNGAGGLLRAYAVEPARTASRVGDRLTDALDPQPVAAQTVAREPRAVAAPLQATPLVDPALVPGLVWAAVAVVGPIGEIFVQEAFEVIGHSPRLLPESALGALVHEVAGRFRSGEGRAQFVARAEAVLAHHGYGRAEESP